MSQIHYPFTQYINHFVKTPIKTIFDIGSRDLEEGIAFSNFYPNAQVYSIEANPEQKEICESKSSCNEEAGNGVSDFRTVHCYRR